MLEPTGVITGRVEGNPLEQFESGRPVRMSFSQREVRSESEELRILSELAFTISARERLSVNARVYILALDTLNVELRGRSEPAFTISAREGSVLVKVCGNKEPLGTLKVVVVVEI